MAGLVHRYGFEVMVEMTPRYGKTKMKFPGSHNAAIDVIQHGNVTTNIPADSKYLEQGLLEDDHHRMIKFLRKSSPKVNPNLVLISLDYEGHDRIYFPTSMSHQNPTGYSDLMAVLTVLRYEVLYKLNALLFTRWKISCICTLKRAAKFCKTRGSIF